MALPKTFDSNGNRNPISFSDIQNEFKDTAGGDTSKNLSGYYRDGDIIATDVEDPNGIPNTSQRTIKFSDFLDAGDFQQVEIGGTTKEANLKSKASSAGWNGDNPVRVIMKSDAVYWGGSYGARTGSDWPMIVKFTIKGKILGKGGKGGDGSTGGNAGGNGSQALRLDQSIHTLEIASGGAIAGGGGGGGSGKSPGYGDSDENAAAGGGGGAGGGKGGSACNFNSSNSPSDKKDGGSGGSVGNAGKNGKDQGSKEGLSDANLFGVGGQAGGGGGGMDVAKEKLGDSLSEHIVGGGAGSGGGGGRIHPGEFTSAGGRTRGSLVGGGGTGGKAGEPGGNSGSANDGGSDAAVAGGGGGWGSSGGSGGSGKSGGSGGKGINLKPGSTTFTIGTFINNGTLNGGKS
jgi:hypothetical protein